MREYPIKKGHEANLQQIMKECFGNVDEENVDFVSVFGALKKITAYVDDEKVFVETEMKKTDDETSSKTINAY
ncbi:MAG: hypothetical protein CO114_07590 [Euryarchaeota archaeon CG_4_9_14_3_um_filter_38_12]|nr:MAG: hypothetical protein CO114_07590 [Euryarchaeota archaeon CG_4_9_14_3_um_filter_38_12]